MNSVQLVGNLTKEVELKYTQSGTAVGTFNLAVSRSYTNQQGERETDFIRCVVWRKTAENLANFTRKGSKIGVEGNINTRSYDNEQGQRVYITEVNVNQFHLLESKEVTEQRPRENQHNNQQQNQQQNYQNNAQNNQSTAFNNQSNVNGQFNNQNTQNNQFGGNMPIQGGTDIEVSQSDLPF